MICKTNSSIVCLLFLFWLKTLNVYAFIITSMTLKTVRQKEKKISNVTNQPNVLNQVSRRSVFQRNRHRSDQAKEQVTVAIDAISKEYIHQLILKIDIQLTFVKTRQMRLTTKLSDDNKSLLLEYLTETMGFLYVITIFL